VFLIHEVSLRQRRTFLPFTRGGGRRSGERGCRSSGRCGVEQWRADSYTSYGSDEFACTRTRGGALARVVQVLAGEFEQSELERPAWLS